MKNKITCNDYEYGDSDIISGSCYLGNSLSNESLSIDTLEASVKMGEAIFLTSDSDGFVTSDGNTFACENPVDEYTYGDEVIFKHSDSLIGKFFFSKFKRSSMLLYTLSAISAIGLLDNMTHYGGVYTEIPAGTIIADIMGDIPYTISEAVATVPMNGYLPIDTGRNNLQQVLFAVGAGILKDADGDIRIEFIVPGTVYEIPNNRIYSGGSVEYETPCTEVDVTEHSYHAYSGDKSVTLLDTSEILTSQRITFDNPCHDLAASGGLTIEQSGVNFAIVSGIGTLTGQEYTHTKRVVAYRTGAAGLENSVSVTNATLVSAFNSYNVAQRVAQYYSSVSTISAGIVVGSERPTDRVSFTSPFGEDVTGYIKSMNITLSSVLKANSDVAIGFVPTGQGNNFNNYVLLTGTGTFTIPAGVTRIYAIIVGSGDGGDGGNPGEDSVIDINGLGGDGGAGGEGGAGAYVLLINLSVTPGSEIPYSCAAGGSGGAVQAEGSAGGNTMFGDLSSADGYRPESGYSEPKSGLVFAESGSTGVSGGRGNNATAALGGPGESITYEGITYNPGQSGATIWVEAANSKAWGGGGGGAAVGNNGGNGGNGWSFYGTYEGVGPHTWAHHGNGGTGASVAIRGKNASSYGQGGGGGHGGGGGGCAVGDLSETYDVPASQKGTGGAGGPAGDGGPGVIVIYY